MTLQKYEKFSDLQIFFIVAHIGTSATMLIKVHQNFPVCLFLQLIELLVGLNACRLAIIHPRSIFPPVLLTFTCILCITCKVRAKITSLVPSHDTRAKFLIQHLDLFILAIRSLLRLAEIGTRRLRGILSIPINRNESFAYDVEVKSFLKFGNGLKCQIVFTFQEH